MPGLILKLRAHEQILVNGVVMQNGERNARLIIKTPDAKILRLRDAIHPQEVDTPVKRVCYIAQLAVAGETETEAARLQMLEGISSLKGAIGKIDDCARALEQAARAAKEGNFYSALRSLRQLLAVEERLLGHARRHSPTTPNARH